ncbi:MAG: MFS transporter [Gammaproteobacteria bacterium]|jgi:MFS transporter, DHA1 family, tetracycline resistance protein|nr:MFS transporter [Gammaproteobacteria bacterium]MBT7306716.1 MFS transporter [Gammaproteobacteria bacterium]
MQQELEGYHKNTLYLLSAICMIFMTMVLAIQPIFLRTVLNVSADEAGMINATVQTVTEVFDLLLVGYLGYLSDRYGRKPVVIYGFLVAALGALIIPSSLELGIWLGLSGLTVFYLMRIIMSLGTAAVWPQLAALAGDFSDQKGRASMMANAAFMMSFGATLVYTVIMQIPQHAGLMLTMYLVAVVALLGAWFANRSLVDVSNRLEEQEVPWKKIAHLLKKDARLRLTFASAFSARNDMVLIGLFLMLWFVYFADIHGLSQEEAVAQGGLLIGAIGGMILITIPAWGWFIGQFGRIAAIVLSMFLSGVGFVLMWFVVNPFQWEIFVPALLIATGQAGTLLAPQVLTIDLSPEEMRGSVLGAFNTVGGFGMIIFVQIGGILFDYLGPYAPFVFTGIGNLAIMLYAFWVMRSCEEPIAPGREDMAVGYDF